MFDRACVALTRGNPVAPVAAQNIQVSVTAQIDPIRQLTQAVDQLAQKDRELVESFKKTNQETVKAQQNFNGLGGAINKIGGIIAGVFAVEKVVEFGQKVLSVRSEFQKLEAVLTNTLGSRSAAAATFTLIRDFAATTNFGVLELTQSFVKLANQGFVPTQAQLRSLADLANSTGKSFDQLTEAIIDAQTFEFERLKEFGIRARKEGENITFTFKGVETQVKANSDAVKEYVLSLGELNGVAGATEAISKTLGGQISNLGDSLDNLFNTILEGREGPVAKVIETLSGLLNLIAENLKSGTVAQQEFASKYVASLDETILKGKDAQGQIAALRGEFDISSEKVKEFEDSLAGARKNLERLRASGETDLGGNEDRIKEIEKELNGELAIREAIAGKIQQIEKGITDAQNKELAERRKQAEKDAKEAEKRRKKEEEETRRWWASIRRLAGEFQQKIADKRIEEEEKLQERLKEARDKDRENFLKQAEDDNKRFGDILRSQREYSEQYAKDLVQIQTDTVGAIGGLLDAFSGLLGNNRELAIAALIVEKAVAIARVVLKTQEEVAGYFAQAAIQFGPAGAAIATPLATAAKVRAGISIATIAATGIAQASGGGRKFRTGTPYLEGPGDGQSDSIGAYMPLGNGTAEFIRLSKGERIVSAEENRKGWHVYEAMRKNPKLIPRLEEFLLGSGLGSASPAQMPRFDDSRIVQAIRQTGDKPMYQTVIDRAGVSLYVQGRNYRHRRNDEMSRMGGRR